MGGARVRSRLARCDQIFAIHYSGLHVRLSWFDIKGSAAAIHEEREHSWGDKSSNETDRTGQKYTYQSSGTQSGDTSI